MSGIKRHVIVDTMGLPHAIAVTTADVTDRDGALQMLLLNLDNCSHVEKFLVDAGYSSERFANQEKDICSAQVEGVKHSELHKVCRSASPLGGRAPFRLARQIPQAFEKL